MKSGTRKSQVNRAATQKDNIEESQNEESRNLLHALLRHFGNDPSKLATALALDEAMVKDWIDGHSLPNTSSLMRMRMLANERLG